MSKSSQGKGDGTGKQTIARRTASAVVASKAPDHLFERVVTILEEARSRVVRAVNGEMVVAYWLIGREIVEALQATMLALATERG